MDAEIRELDQEEVNQILDGMFHHTNLKKWLHKGYRNPTSVLEKEVSRYQGSRLSYRGNFLVFDNRGFNPMEGVLDISAEQDRLSLFLLLNVPEDTDFEYGIGDAEKTLAEIAQSELPLYMSYNLRDSDSLYRPLIITSDLRRGIVIGPTLESALVEGEEKEAVEKGEVVPLETKAEVGVEVEIPVAEEEEEYEPRIHRDMPREEIVAYLRERMDEKIEGYKQGEDLNLVEIAEKLDMLPKSLNILVYNLRKKGLIGNSIRRKGRSSVLSPRDSVYLLNRFKGEKVNYDTENIPRHFGITQTEAEILNLMGIIGTFKAHLKKKDLISLYNEVFEMEAGTEESGREKVEVREAEESGRVKSSESDLVSLHKIAEEQGVDPSEIFKIIKNLGIEYVTNPKEEVPVPSVSYDQALKIERRLENVKKRVNG